jgi:hypothetical protein
MVTKVKNRIRKIITIDSTLNKYKGKDIFPNKTNQFNAMVDRIGEDKFMQLTGAKKK